MGAKSYQDGVKSEQKAVAFLQKQKHAVIRRRYRTSVGEIDIISEKDSVLHITEVKKRRTLTLAREAVSERQQSRINKAVEVFIKSSETIYDGIQMNVIFIANNELRYLENAWCL
ncbi:MAG: YraN family protein [Holosporales bacterium]|jgi:putative endonuclease|nr:YraN family protein [Holosporales bacterium]